MKDRLQFSERSYAPVQCTAGRSYFVIRGDGTIYRCLYNPQALGSITQPRPPVLPGALLTCQHKNAHGSLDDRCHPSGDLMFCTWWENGVMHEAPWPPWNEGKQPEESVGDRAYFVCLPVNSRCNLACSFCCNFYMETPDGKVIGRPKDHAKDLPLETWSGFVARCASVFKWCHFAFLGGEPTLYHALPELAAKIVAAGWEVGICSNMMATPVFARIIDLCPDPSLLSFTASCHPSATGFDWDRYIQSVAICASAGCKVRATLVSWPEHTYAYEWIRDRLASIGVPIWLKAIGGYDIGPDWPYVKRMGGTMQTYEYLRQIGWIGDKTPAGA